MSQTTQLLHVQGMSCQHCVKSVTQAVRALDPDSEVAVDLPSGTVSVKSALERDQLVRAIGEEGYKVQP